jgi:hypothetical protein
MQAAGSGGDQLSVKQKETVSIDAKEYPVPVFLQTPKND